MYLPDISMCIKSHQVRNKSQSTEWKGKEKILTMIETKRIVEKRKKLHLNGNFGRLPNVEIDPNLGVSPKI